MATTPTPTVTSLLRDWRSGDPEALSQLTPQIYEDLHRIAARTMRHILTAYGRARHTAKRGGGVSPIALDESRVALAASADIVDLDDALEKLASIDARKSDMLVLHYFGGMTYDETAAALDVSAATVDRDLRLAKAWLANELKND